MSSESPDKHRQFGVLARVIGLVGRVRVRLEVRVQGRTGRVRLRGQRVLKPGRMLANLVPTTFANEMHAPPGDQHLLQVHTVTVNNIKDNYGFIHSAWYPKLYPRVTCHSLIQNKPDHYIVIYSVSGSIGLDRIQIESVDNKGALAFREILTGNLTTQLVITSAYDVNVTVLTEDTYYFDQRRFLLYFYIVPKCFVILCSNSTGHPYSPTGGSYGVMSVAPPGYYPPVVGYSTSSASNVYASTSSDAYATVYKPPEYTYAPPLVADNHYKHHSKISDAWLAAILALIYSLLMVFAVLVAIYCRRRRRRRLIQENNIIFGPSTVSSSQIINPSTISRTQSQISIAREHSLPISSSNYLTMSKHQQCIDQNTIYSQVNRENYLIHQQQQQQHCQYQLHRDEDDLEDDDQRVIASTYERVTHIPACAPPVPVPLARDDHVRRIDHNYHSTTTARKYQLPSFGQV